MMPHGYSTSELLEWFTERLDLYGYKAAPCAMCHRDGEISITVLHGLLVRAVNELRQKACGVQPSALNDDECVPLGLVEEWAQETLTGGRAHVYQDRQALAREVLERRKHHV